MSKTLERIKELQAELDASIEKAVKDLLKRRDAIDQELAELGHKTKARTRRARTPRIQHCGICDIDGHDARSHRNTKDPTKPFTKAELKERNLPTG